MSISSARSARTPSSSASSSCAHRRPARRCSRCAKARDVTTRVKICGVTLPDDAAHAVAAGADFLGLNFWPQSKRYLDPARAPIVAEAARAAGNVQLAGVFVDARLEDIVAV